MYCVCCKLLANNYDADPEFFLKYSLFTIVIPADSQQQKIIFVGGGMTLYWVQLFSG